MTAFLVIAGYTVPVAEGTAVKRFERDGGNERAFNGSLRYTGTYERRAWQVTTGLMLDADAALVETVIALGAQATCSGNLFGGTVVCAVEQGDSGYVSTATSDGLGYMRTLSLLLREAPTLAAAMAAFRASAPATRVSYNNYSGGAVTGIFVGGAGVGITYLADYPLGRIRQDGFVRQVKLVKNDSGSTGWKVKVFRPVAGTTTLTYVGQSEVFNLTGILQNRTVDLATPIPCRVGDLLAVFVPGTGTSTTAGELWATSNAQAAGRYATGDITANNAFASTVGAYNPSLQALGTSPFLVGAGDSIMEGHNVTVTSTDQWHTYNHATTGINNPAAQPLYGIRSIVPVLDYQNEGVGGQNWSWMSSHVATHVALGSRAIWYACGLNDAYLPRTWAAVQADLDTIRAGVPSTVKLLISEVLPDSASTTTIANQIRAYNASYATWCAANNAVLIACHDAMGQLRVSTGQLDDLKPGYAREDGTHLSAAGVTAYARLIAAALDAVSW